MTSYVYYILRLVATGRLVVTKRQPTSRLENFLVAVPMLINRG